MGYHYAPGTSYEGHELTEIQLLLLHRNSRAGFLKCNLLSWGILGAEHCRR